ncbi:helix-turn-helix transcriptional regulator [Streptomyces sp. 549]|uniref:PadR family transcriptional regulator n=1 Tax=Streptomyces sp. 549 TaxID=3049076 RepID=UPI0024C2FFAE|nr:helix-turn-helix transcriptional regulator [Streptomyces sp. 549]MDK1476876.1 helix-turn-helix transcriptional regulator [Streptomyces sp. 549]
MSATRLLVLGAVRRHGIAHGYLVSRELDAIGAQKWAKLKSGSIYHALRQLTKDGLMHAAQIDEWPGRVDYRVTEQGEREFVRLLRDALRKPGPRADLLAAALSLLSEIPRDEAAELLRERLSAQEAERADLADQMEAAEDSGRLAELYGMLMQSADCGVAWTRSLLERLESPPESAAGRPSP